jgi:hypothetical protein
MIVQYFYQQDNCYLTEEVVFEFDIRFVNLFEKTLVQYCNSTLFGKVIDNPRQRPTGPDLAPSG